MVNPMKRESKATSVTAIIFADAMPAPIGEPNPEISSSASPEPRVSRLDPWLLIVFVLTILTCMPFLHMVYGLGDEGVLLNGAERIRHGETIYKDFFEFLPPGGFMLTVWWWGIAGVSVLSARLLGIIIIVGVACFTYLAVKIITRSGPYSAMITIAWVVSSQGMLIQLNHHWLTTCLCMIAFYLALASVGRPQQRPRLAFWAGTTAAAAVMITPSCGVLTWLAAATFFMRHGRMARLTYLMGSALVPAYVLSCLQAHHDLASAYADCIVFPAAHYASIQGVPFGFWEGAQTYPLASLFPLAGVLTIFVCASNGLHRLREGRLQISLAFAFAGFIGCFPRPDIAHIAYGAPLALPLFAYCAATLAQQCQPIFVTILRAGLIILYVPSALSFAYISNMALHTPITPTPRGIVSLFGKTGTADMLERVAATPIGAQYFFYPNLQYMSFLTAREQVSKYDLFTPGYTLASQYQDACLSVMRHADYVIISRQGADPTFLKRDFPAMQNPNPPEKQAFETALNRGFNLVAVDKSFELRHRNAAASTALCTGITP